ncbi:MAG: helix-turn-helix domain-containing protein [Anaerocolumna sp.]
MANLLIVDDEVYAIRGVREGVNWSRLNIKEVFTANSVKQAKEILLQHKVDIILCDIEMPQEDGLCLIKWLRGKNDEIECIFLTCHADFKFAQEALRLNSFDYLVKPVAYEILEDRLDKVVDRINIKEEEQRILKYGEIYLDSVRHEVKEKFGTKKSCREIVEEVSKYILNNINEDLSVELLAKQEYLNPDYLTRIFKKEMGCSILNYIINERLRMAAHLLSGTDASVNEIAIEVGYPNYSHFTKMFRKFFGVTPSHYRQNCLDGKAQENCAEYQ